MTDHNSILQELRRELATRNSVYPRWIKAGHISKTTAAHRISMIEQAIEVVESVQSKQLSLLGEHS